MLNWRVIELRDEDGVPYFTIEDVVKSRAPHISPFVKHIPPYPHTTTKEELRERLMEMVAAVDKPVMAFTPSKLVEKP